MWTPTGVPGDNDIAYASSGTITMSSYYSLTGIFSGDVVLSTPTSFYLGGSAGMSGSFHFTDTSKLSGSGYLYVGEYSGTGNILVDGNAMIDINHNSNSTIYLGRSNGQGVLTVRDNALVSSRYIEIGGGGTGIINLESGTINAWKENQPGWSYIGGIVNQSGGVFTTDTMAIERNDVTDLSRMYRQGGGTLTVANLLEVGRSSKHGVLNLSGGAVTSIATVTSATGLIVGSGYQATGEINIRDNAQLSVEFGKFTLGDGSQAVGTLNIDGGVVYTHALPTQLGVNGGRGYVYQRGGEVHTAGVVIGSGSYYSFIDGELSVFHSGTPAAIAGQGEFRDYGGKGTINTQVLGQSNLMTTRFYLDSSDPGVSPIQVSDTVNLSLVTVDTTVWGWAQLYHDQAGGRYNLIDISAATVTGSLRAGNNVLSPYYSLKQDSDYVYLEFNQNVIGGMQWQIATEKFYVPSTYAQSGILKVSHDWVDGILATFSGLEGNPDLARHLVDYLNQGLRDAPVKFNYYGGSVLALSGDFLGSDPYAFFAWDLQEFNAQYGLTGSSAVTLLSLQIPEPSTWVMMIFGCVFLTVRRRYFAPK